MNESPNHSPVPLKKIKVNTKGAGCISILRIERSMAVGNLQRFKKQATNPTNKENFRQL